MTKVKICGLKTEEHVRAAIEAKADFIGFVFAPSKRQISVETAKTLAALIPPTIKKIGVVVNETSDTLHHLFTEVGLDYIQYHGDEPPAFIDEVGLPAIKAFSITEAFDWKQLNNFKVDFYLLDAPGSSHRGGSGKTFNWEFIKDYPIPKEKIILAGGLNAANVTEAIQITKPFAVDVSSGVEKNGLKDSNLITQFINAAKGVRQHD